MATRRRFGADERLLHGRVSLPAFLDLTRGSSSKAGQWAPVVSKTTWLGMRRVLIPKTRQPRGNRGSQVT